MQCCQVNAKLHNLTHAHSPLLVAKPLASAMADNGSCSFQRGFDALEVELLRFNRNQNRATNRGKAPKLTLLLLGSTLQGGVGCCRSGCKGNFRHSITVASVCRCCVCRCVVWHCNINTIIIRCVCSCCCVCSRCHRWHVLVSCSKQQQWHQKQQRQQLHWSFQHEWAPNDGSELKAAFDAAVVPSASWHWTLSLPLLLFFAMLPKESFSCVLNKSSQSRDSKLCRFSVGFLQMQTRHELTQDSTSEQAVVDTVRGASSGEFKQDSASGWSTRAGQIQLTLLRWMTAWEERTEWRQCLWRRKWWNRPTWNPTWWVNPHGAILDGDDGNWWITGSVRSLFDQPLALGLCELEREDAF